MTVRDLIEFFRSSVVPPSENQVGTEYEIFCLKKDDFSRLSYDGSPGIREILDTLLELTGGEPVMDAGRPIGLKDNDFSVSIEPGGQLEASFSPCRTVGELSGKLKNYLALLHEAGSPGAVFIGSGVDPVNSFDDVPWMPKQRYQIMRRYWEAKPGLSLYMMKQTAAIQVSIDYNSEEDAVRKLQNAVILSDLLTDFFSNSPIYDLVYRYTGSFRKKIWCRTDKERSGTPAGCGRPISSFADYVDYALDVPIIFLYRSGRYYEMAERLTFRKFLSAGFQGTYPDLNDWLTHLNTIFSLVRFNNTTLEIRTFDSNRPEMVLAITACVKGLFYGGEVYEPLMPPAEMLARARAGLPADEAEYLAPLDLILREGRTSAARACEAFSGEEGISALIDRLRIG
ncbi:MAG: glutamate-cysteine ligase family protein [PVC group bacterium]